MNYETVPRGLNQTCLKLGCKEGHDENSDLSDSSDFSDFTRSGPMCDFSSFTLAITNRAMTKTQTSRTSRSLLDQARGPTFRLLPYNK